MSRAMGDAISRVDGRPIGQSTGQAAGQAGDILARIADAKRLPLIAGFGADAVFARRGERVFTVQDFLRDAARLAARLPERGFLLNLCGDRYRFVVGFAAALMRGQVSLLPPNQAPELMELLKADYPDVYCLREAESPAPAMHSVLFGEESASAPGDLAVPLIPAAQTAAIVFTSGSTGVPQPNRKSWGKLTQSAQGEAARLGLDAGWSLVGTVPPQHMYGFESTVLMPMQNGLALHAGRPFYPADIAQALASLPRPRALITTPVHLRALVDTLDQPWGAVPEPDFMLCATAPLSPDLAAAAEARLDAPLHEIYGCTEAGQVATRRSIEGARWKALPGLQLRQDAQGTRVSGGHVEGEILLGDVIELIDPDEGRATHFELRGRNADMINIAGKRTSLAALNFQLTAIAGVRDGVFVMPQEQGEVTRLTAIVVAPGVSARSINAALKRVLDPVFLPRPLYFVDDLPRNSTGKLTHAAVQALLAQCRAASRH
jgi:acyl-coenzyme A synthetase/AMP-(fatty) acid ligase